jgi:outer membrane protein OmpA-like peptidoglycan-associated protein
MLFGMVYFAFGPVRDYVADTILKDSEPPPLASFASDTAKEEVTPPSSGTVQNQSSVIAVPNADAEVPTAYKSSGESGPAKNEEPGEPGDSPGQTVPLQKAELETDVASSQLQTAVLKESVNTGIAGSAGDTSAKTPTATDSEKNAPKTTVADTENDLVMIGDAQRAIIFFHHDSHNLPEQAGAQLKRLLETAIRSPSARISIMGYTDALGNEWYNRKLSQTRADIVRDFFIARGIEPEKIRAVGMGPENPIASNDTADGRRKNRRVEVYIGSAVN